VIEAIKGIESELSELHNQISQLTTHCQKESYSGFIFLFLDKFLLS
jgi:hypothetical protein